MKAQEGVAPPRSNGEAQPHKAATGEWEGKVVPMGEEFIELEETTERAVVDLEGVTPVPVPVPLPAPVPAAIPKRGESTYVPRERRPTLVSPIPAQLAKSMGEVREPGAPSVMHHEVTRRVADVSLSGPVHSTTATAPPTAITETETFENYSVELLEELSLPPKEQVEMLIERARASIDRGNLGAAVIAADQALAEAAKAPEEAVADLVKVARPLFDRIFAAYVGLLAEVPVRARTDEQIAGQELGDRTTLLLGRVDGMLTLEELSRATEIPPVEAMQIAASLLAAGIIRIK